MVRSDGFTKHLKSSVPAPAVSACVWAWLATTATEVSGRPRTSDPLGAIRDYWGSDVTTPMPWMLVAIGGLLTLLAVMLIVRHWRERHRRSQPWAVFQQVAAAAELSIADQWLLVRISRQQHLPTPLTLLLSARTLRVHAREFAQSHAPWRRAAIMQRVASIRRHVFGRMDVESPV